jgi:hypothetical protein
MDVDREISAERGPPDVADADAAGEGRQEILAEPARTEADQAGGNGVPVVVIEGWEPKPAAKSARKYHSGS